MEKMMNIQIEHNREEMEEREKTLKEKEEQIRVKYSLIENNLKQKDNYFAVDIDGLELSLESISFKKQESMLDSGIFNIRNLLSSHKVNPQHQIKKLQELQSKILSVLPSPPQLLYDFFKISNQFCLDNCRLLEELLNYQQTHEIYRHKIQQYQKAVMVIRRSQNSLKKENRQLNQYYIKQQVKFQQQIGLLRDQIYSRKAQIQQLKFQIAGIVEKSASKNSWSQIFKSNKYSLARCGGQRWITTKQSSNFIYISNNKSSKQNTTSISPNASIERPPNLGRRRIEIQRLNL